MLLNLLPGTVLEQKLGKTGVYQRFVLILESWLLGSVDGRCLKMLRGVWECYPPFPSRHSLGDTPCLPLKAVAKYPGEEYPAW